MVKKILDYLKLEESGKLSITNLAMITILIKFAISPFEWGSALSLFIVCLNYSHKRYLNAKAIESGLDVDTKIKTALGESTDRLEKLESTITRVALKFGLTK